MKRNFSPGILAPFLALALQGSLHSQWTTAQGGNSRRDGQATTHGPAAPAQSWSISQRTGFASAPLIGDGRVVYSRTDPASPGGSVIEAADLRTGQPLWSTTLPGGLSPFTLPIAMRDGRVYARRASPALVNEFLYALDASTGALLWQSQDLVQMHLFSSPSFLANGDILINGEYVISLGWRLLRIDHLTGGTVWNRPPGEGANPPAAGGAVFQDRFYLAHELAGAYEVERINSGTGERMYGSALESVAATAAATSNNPMVGADGTIYWPYGGVSTGGEAELIALTDTGTSLVEKWRAPMADLWTSSLGVAPDGMILSYSRQNELVRLDPATGAVVARSAELPVDLLRVNTTVDRGNRVFVVACGEGPTPIQLLAYGPQLRLQWSLLLGLSPAAGASVAEGHLVVSTAREVVRAFEFDSFRRVPGDCTSNASVSYRNGTGLNRPCFFPTDLPRVGATWTAEIFAGVHPAPTLYGLVMHASPGSALLPFGELLVDPGSQRFLSRIRPTNGGIDILELGLPDDPTLCGIHVSAQAFMLGSPRPVMCNALDLVLGN
jgi:outer membrane protein assembly factor BamB